ncbi:MAG: TIGR03915 family putative DNA repair protein [Bacillota bacterium]|nr:TIGR03915 family putative DNA repair protein [Bacillota bacterium]
MLDYLYDGTFEGILTCIYHHYYTGKASGIFPQGEYQPTLLADFMEVETDSFKATAVYEAIEKKISSYDLRRIYKAYLSCDHDKEMKILRYVELGFRQGASVSMLHGNPVVFDIQSIEKKINVETERMLQFVRFSVMDGDVLYSRIEPDNDVLELLHTHFCDRFRNDPFIIHDFRRRKALIAYQNRWYISEFDDSDIPEPSEEEQSYRLLWKNYFDNISIKERTNPRCQKNFMPVRYWKHLTEMNTI